MNLICLQSGCEGAPQAPPSNYDTCTREVRSCGGLQIGFATCDLVFIDVLDPAEWDAFILAGKIQFSPIGIVTLDEPTFDLIPIECNQEEPGDLSWVLNYNTTRTRDDLTDYDYWCELYDKYKSLRLFWLECDGRWRFPKAVLDVMNAGGGPLPSGQSLGWNYSFSTPPHEIPSADGKRCEWAPKFKFDTQGCLGARYMPELVSVI